MNTAEAGFSFRERFIIFVVVVGLWIFLTTEVLSIFHALNTPMIVGMWGLFFALIIAACWRLRSRVSLKSPGPRVDNVAWLYLTGIGLIALATLLLALLAPPNTYDTMTYHMGRVVHWAQNGTLDPYPTSNPRQIFFLPFQEYCALHLYLLGQGDQWVNLVQWSAMIVSLVGASLIARELGASLRGQMLAAVVVATIPMGILQASSLQGDYTVTMWITCAVFFFFRWRLTAGWLWVGLMGCALGLGCLTKGTACLLFVPILLWMVGGILWRRSGKGAVQFLLVLGLIVLINLPFYMRHWELRAYPVATTETKNILVDRPGVDTLVANILRNAATHFCTSSDLLNQQVLSTVESIAGFLHVPLNDPRASFAGYQFSITPLSVSEDLAANPVHFLLFLVLSVMLWYGRWFSSDMRKYWLCLLGMFFVFSFFVRWQPWIARFHLPFFVLGAALLAAVLDRGLLRKWQILIFILFLFVAAPAILNGFPRPLLGVRSVLALPREMQYFSHGRGKYLLYGNIVQGIRQASCRNIGFVLGGDSLESPWWALLGEPKAGYRIEHVFVDGPLGQLPYPLGAFDPCLIISESDLTAQAQTDRKVRLLGKAGNFYIYSGKN